VRPAPVISLAEVHRHDTENDCWMVLGGKVYNATPYMDYHPAGIPQVGDHDHHARTPHPHHQATVGHCRPLLTTAGHCLATCDRC
jgi:cytochrome b involved in lipid metabolism